MKEYEYLDQNGEPVPIQFKHRSRLHQLVTTLINKLKNKLISN